MDELERQRIGGEVGQHVLQTSGCGERTALQPKSQTVKIKCFTQPGSVSLTLRESHAMRISGRFHKLAPSQQQAEEPAGDGCEKEIRLAGYGLLKMIGGISGMGQETEYGPVPRQACSAITYR
ncbi:hypothetical protein [Breoghania sp.]|uniref:hypothetical protein n=1 Tax=Breoghania sp. TaxID=2065378 RepID=UPI002AAB4FD3|nr:hypothetical protein [Breoghania sp.]